MRPRRYPYYAPARPAGNGCAIFGVFICGLLALYGGFAGNFITIAIGLGFAVLCMLSAILARFH